jgi:hypothetical protein
MKFLYELIHSSEAGGKVVESIGLDGLDSFVMVKFTDKTFVCLGALIHYEDIFMKELSETNDVIEHLGYSLVIEGIVKQEEYDKYKRELKEQQQKAAEELERANYEKLRAKFEKTN